MTIDLNFSNKLVGKALRKHDGVIGKTRTNGPNHEIDFTIKGLRFRLIFDSRDGRKLIQLRENGDVDIFQHLYGFKGNRSDVDAVLKWTESIPGFGEIRAGSVFLFECLDEYLILKGKPD